MKYQVYFRVNRGGTGIPYELAKTEFLAVFDLYGLRIDREYAARRRMWVDMALQPDQVKRLASDLGYTAAILYQEFVSYRGESLSPIETGRWYIGWVRQGDYKVLQTEVYVQDAKSLLNESPDRRPFELERNGQKSRAKGHHPRRALSSLDARFLFNIARLTPTMRVLDPFAGFGGVVFEAGRRGLAIFAADIDPGLSPGLAQLASQRCFVGDARFPPLRTGAFDAIITEPPFRTRYRQAVIEALPELRRVLKPNGRIFLLISADMREDICACLKSMGAHVKQIQVIPRDNGLQCPVLEVLFPESSDAKR